MLDALREMAVEKFYGNGKRQYCAGRSERGGSREVLQYWRCQRDEQSTRSDCENEAKPTQSSSLIKTGLTFCTKKKIGDEVECKINCQFGN